MTDDRTSHLAPATLEAIAAGEPSADAHVRACGACQERIAALREASLEFLRRQPPELFLRKLHRRKKRPARRAWLLALAGCCASAVALVLAAPRNQIRAKGSALGIVYRRGNERAKPVAPEQRLQAGDALRFSYAPAGPGYLAILDLDGTGKVTVFHPYGGTSAVPLAPTGDGFLPGSVVLDSAPGAEWIVSVFDERPFEVAPLTAQLAALPAGATPLLHCGSCRVDSLRIHKLP